MLQHISQFIPFITEVVFHCVDIPRFIHSLVERTLGLFTVFACYRVAMNINLQVFVWMSLYLSWVNAYQWNDWTIWLVYTSLFKKLLNHFPKWLCYFTFLPAAQRVTVLHPFPYLVGHSLFQLFWQMCSDVSLHFPVINDVEHVCMSCLPSISHLWGYVCSNICPTCFFIFSFSLLGFENSLSILNTSSLSQDTFKKENKKISPGLGENLCELCI